jgi:hypothetical protein
MKMGHPITRTRNEPSSMPAPRHFSKKTFAN